MMCREYRIVQADFEGRKYLQVELFIRRSSSERVTASKR
jgi:hypothetical protein